MSGVFYSMANYVKSSQALHKTAARHIVYWVLILALLIAAMYPGLKGTFMFDDYPNIVDNEAVHLGSLNIDSLRQSLSSPQAGPLGRPVSVLSFALTYYVFGLDPFAFKAVNLVIHALNGILVAWFVSLLLCVFNFSKSSEASRQWLPYWVAAIWLLHPINILPVMLSVQRMVMLSTTFSLLAIIAYLKGMTSPTGARIKWKWLATSWLVFWPLAILSKETGLLCPLYAAAISLFANRESTVLRRRLALAGIVAFTVSASALVYSLGWSWLDRLYALRPFTLTERLMTEARVLWFYIAQILLPNHTAFGIYLDDFTISKSLVAPPLTLIAILAWAATIIALIYGARRQPVLCFSMAWFLIGHLLESTFVPLEMVHEYRNYLPSVGLIFGAGYLGASLLQRIKIDNPVLTTGLIAVASIALVSLLTWLRATQFGNPIIGPQIEAERHPQSPRANYEAAFALIKAGYGSVDDLTGQQIRYYLEKTDAVDPNFKFGSFELIFWACASGRPVEKQWIKRTADRFTHTPFAPGDWKLPDQLLKHVLSAPKCLSRQDALALFIAGAENSKITPIIKKSFLEAAADYELLVWIDPQSAQRYLAKAVMFAPGDTKLHQKLNSFGQVNLEATARNAEMKE